MSIGDRPSIPATDYRARTNAAENRATDANDDWRARLPEADRPPAAPVGRRDGGNGAGRPRTGPAASDTGSWEHSPTTAERLAADPTTTERLSPPLDTVDVDDRDARPVARPPHPFVSPFEPLPEWTLDTSLRARPAETDAAARAFDEAVARRDAMPLHLQPHYQSAVDRAGITLEHAVQAEISDARRDRPGTSAADETRRLGRDIVTRQVAGSAGAAETAAVVERLTLDVEADAEVAAALDDIGRADSPEQAFERLDTHVTAASPEARTRLLDEPAVDDLLDDVAAVAAAPLDELDDPEHTPQALVDETLWNLEARLPSGVDPDLAARLVARVQPALERAEVANVARNAEYGTDTPLVDESSIGPLGRLSDRVDGASDGQRRIDALARLAEDTMARPDAWLRGRSPDVANGEGLPLALALLRLADADPDIDSGAVLDRILDDYAYYVDDSEGPVATSIAAYAEHTEELNVYLTFFVPPDASPEVREELTADYLESRDQAWHDRLAELELDIAAHGANAHLMREQLTDLPPELAHRTDATETRLMAIAGGDNFTIITTTAANRHPELLTDIDIGEAIGFLHDARRATGRSPLGLSRSLESLANARFQNTIADAIGELDPLDVASVRDARVAINGLRTPAIADAWGIDPETRDAALDALLETLPDSKGRFVSRQSAEVAFEQLDETLDGLEKFGATDPLGVAFRAIGLANGAVSVYGSIDALASDPTLERAARAFVDGAGLLRDGVVTLGDVGVLGKDNFLLRRFGAGTTAGRLLGTAGLALGAVSVIRDIEEGDWSQAAVGTIGLGGAAWATFGASAYAGPWGIGIALGAAAFSIGIDQYRRVIDSNRYTGVEARDALDVVGFDEDAQFSLADRSGEGFGAVQLLYRYGKLHGLDGAETIEWINALPKEQLDFVRDRLHHTLDKYDGDVERFAATADEDGYVTSVIESSPNPPLYALTPLSAASADAILEAEGIPLPA